MLYDTERDTCINNQLKYPEPPCTMLTRFVKEQDNALFATDSVQEGLIYIQKKTLPPPSYVKSIVNVRSAKVKQQEIKEFAFYNTSWIFWSLLLCFAVYAFLQKNFGKKQSVIFKSFFNLRYSNQLMREGNIYNESDFYFLLFLSLISFCLYLLALSSYLLLGNVLFFNSLITFIKIIALFFVAYFGKILLLKMIAVIFKLDKLYSEFVLTQHIFIITSGVAALFICVLIFFTPYKAVVLFSVLIYLSLFINYILRLYMHTSGAGIFSLYYFILYICTLVILPLLFVYKLTHK